MPDPDLTLEMQNVTIASLSVPTRPVLGGVNWEVRRNDYWVVGGLPGSGKSDLLATAAGLQKPLNGNVRLFGQEVLALREETLVQTRLRAGFVFEHGGRLFQHMTVFENVALPLRYHGNLHLSETVEAVNQLLALTGLSEVAGRTPATLPRNLRQRVGLTRALAMQPEMLVLDNPLAGLDPRQTGWWVEFLGKLAAGHPAWQPGRITLVVGTDDFRPWTSQGDRFALIKEGQWIDLGNHAGFLETEEPLVKEMLAADFFKD